MRITRLLLLVALALGATATTAEADFGPPVSMGLTGEPREARDGDLYTARLFIEASADVDLSNLRIEGPGWSGVRVDAPASWQMAEGERVEFDITALPSDVGQPLTLAVDWDGQVLRKPLNLSPANVRKARGGGAMLPSRDDRTPDVDPSKQPDGLEPWSGSLPEHMWQAKVEKLDLAEWANEREDEAEVAKASYDIRVQGRWTYWRNDNFHIGADAVTVEIYDFDVLSPPDLLASTLTSAHGFFDITFHWDSIDTPDLFVVFWAANSVTQVEHDTWPHLIRSWSSDVQHNFGGTHWNIGTRQPPEGDYPAVHIHNGITRSWRWSWNLGYECRPVEVWWPEGDGASYNDDHDRIKISSGSQWREGTQSHEYGHHWMNCFATISSPDYCNGFCDDDVSEEDCGHCLWCNENEQDAWQEGFADYFGYTIPGTYLAEYANAATSRTQVGGLDTCGVDSAVHDPDETEGFIAAALSDIHDPVDPADDHPIFSGYADALGMGSDEILACVDQVNPRSPMAFLMEFKDRNLSIREDLWETAMNCGFDIDEHPPSNVTGLGSSSHTFAVASPNAEVTMFWNRAYDDASGIRGYSISFSEDVPSAPGYSQDIDDVTTVTSEPLAAGSYYFNIRSRDRDGRWGTGAAAIGPIVIRDPEPADVAEYSRAGWDYTLVPSSLADHTWTTAHVSPTLTGNSTATWYSMSAKNLGEVSTSEFIRGGFWVDGEYTDHVDWAPILGGGTFGTLNHGPLLVPGGRHSIYFKLDSQNRIAEPNEYNNYSGRQYVWTPRELGVGMTYLRNPPPEWDGGWDHLDPESPYFFNCDGLRFTSEGWWNAVVAWGTNMDDNYDIRLHHDSTGSEDGFGGILRHSGRGAGCVDALIVNRNTMGNQDWDVGVVNLWDAGDDAYKVVHLASPEIPWYVDDVYTIDFGTNNFLAIRELYVGSAFVGPVSLFVSTDPVATPIYVQWRDEDFGYGKLSEPDLEVVTGADGKVHLQLDIPDTGYHGLVFYRDPIDGNDPVTITVDIKLTPPDLLPYFAAGWHSPVVPRPADDGTPTSVPVPDVLYGNQASTYYNFSLRNQSPGDAVDLLANIYVDGQSGVGLFYPSFPGWANSRFNWDVPHTLTGGRHTLSLWIDADELVEEIEDENNIYGEQYIWTPLSMVAGTSVTRAVPPEPTGGWTHIESGEAHWYNCDGLRINPKGSTTFMAMASMSGRSGNVDVRLHEATTGAKSGFSSNWTRSSWGTASSDFVVVNFNITPSRNMDVGVLNVSGTQNYVAECVRATAFGPVPGNTGQVTLGSGEIVDLYAIVLPVGRFKFSHKAGLFGDTDWGVSLHPHDARYLNKSTIVPGGAAWLNPGGKGESFTVDIDDPGTYCLAVWKVGSDDIGRSESYTVYVTQEVTAVADGPPPKSTQVTALYPNPFNPRVNIAFDLARAEMVEITVYNVAGARVCSLLRERRPAGSHRITWDGRDDNGRQVSSGMYVLRLHAGEVQQSRRMVLLK